ncbi:MAG: hypothetical protein HDS64_06815 [Bacteroidales bacterium]|nr:hypothetical protein [Bacteroidales bacterium]MBD5373598.1 hypothetical protein [Bacteroides sp.]
MTGHRGAPATMERKLHIFRLCWDIYVADAPPWRVRHGARCLPLNQGFCNTCYCVAPGVGFIAMERRIPIRRHLAQAV